jgi:nitric oxide reductase NorQ protein
MLPLERTGETLQAPPGFMLVVSYNPGYQNLLKSMKPSTRQRFVAMSFEFPPPALETEILCGETGIEPELAERLIALAGALRALKDHDLEEAASTRLLVYTARLVQSGLALREACVAALAEPLSDDPETIGALCEVIDASLG